MPRTVHARERNTPTQELWNTAEGTKASFRLARHDASSKGGTLDGNKTNKTSQGQTKGDREREKSNRVVRWADHGWDPMEA